MKKSGAAGLGVIQNARDPFAYLGHFRDSKYLKAGHNQIAELLSTALGTGLHLGMNMLSNKLNGVMGGGSDSQSSPLMPGMY